MSDKFDIDASGNARVNAIAKVFGDINFGDRTNFQQQVTVVWSESIAPKHDNSRSLDDLDNLKRWVDRAEPQADLLKRIDEQRWLIEIVADSGFGKSLLAAWLYDEVGNKFGRSLWVGFSKVQEFDQFARWVLQEIGYLVDQQKTDEELLSQLVLRLTENRCLLVMDQLEAVWNKKNVDSLEAARHEKNVALFERFLQAWQKDGRKSVVLVTTQQELAESCDRLLLTGFSVNEGITFLTQQQITEHTEDGFSQLVQIADGHPLLLNLAASWLKQDAKGEITAASLGFFERLFRSYEGDRAAQVDEIFAALFTALPERLRSLLLNMVVYRDAIGLEMAQAILPDASIADLQTLEDRAFLRSLSSEKWTLHPLMLRSVQQALRDSGQEREAHQKAIAYFIANIKPSMATITDCAEELEIFHHRCELGEYALACQSMDTCVNFLNRRGYYRILLPIYDQLTHDWSLKNPNDAEDQRNLGWAWTRLGNLYQDVGQYQAAIAAHEKAQTLFNKISFPHGKAASLGSLSNAYQSLGQYERAIDFSQQSLEIAREIGDRSGEANSLINLGNTHNTVGQYERAIDFSQQSLEIAREIGERSSEAKSLSNLGNSCLSLGQYAWAIDFLQQSLEIEREIGDRSHEAKSFGSLGNVCLSLGQYPRAIDFLQQSLEIEREIGDRSGEANSLISLGSASLSLEQYARAIDFLQQSLEIEREIGDRSGEAKSLNNLGSASLSLGQYARAIDFLQQSLEIKRDIGDRNGEAKSLVSLGSASLSLGQYARAIEFYQQSLEIAREVGDRCVEGASLLNKAQALAKYEPRRFEALDTLQQARAIYTKLKLDHMVEQCDEAIYNFNQIIATEQRQSAPVLPSTPTIGNAPPKDDWYERSLPTRSHPRPVSQRQINWVLWFCVGLAIVLLIAWLRSR